VAVMLVLGGCIMATPEMIKVSHDAADHYYAAIKNNSLSITCSDKPACDKAFSLTKVYIAEHSDMRIQHSDDTTVSTFAPVVYRPHDRAFADNLGLISFGATRAPGSGDSATITLSVYCSGLEGELDVVNNADHHIKSDPAFNRACLNKIAAIYKEFKPYIESRLK
jgi:hypothetical protein